MNLKANAHKGYMLKYLLIGLIALAFGLVHLKDAILVYPGLRPMADEFELLREPLDEHGETTVPTPELQESWQSLAAENGWPEQFPKLNKEIDNLLLYNYFIGIVFTPIALFCLWIVAMTFGRSVKLEGDELTDDKGNTVNIKDVVEIDKKRWEKKGLVTLTTKSGAQKQKMVLDDLKFDRGTVDEILMHIEETVGVNKIINGKTEAHYNQQRQEKLAEREAKKQRLNEMDDEE